MSEIVERIEECLKNFKSNTIRINQTGFMFEQFFIEKLIYKIETDILTLKDENKEIYLSINLNQVYQFETNKNEIILYLDNDTQIKMTSSNHSKK